MLVRTKTSPLLTGESFRAYMLLPVVVCHSFTSLGLGLVLPDRTAVEVVGTVALLLGAPVSIKLTISMVVPVHSAEFIIILLQIKPNVV